MAATEPQAVAVEQSDRDAASAVRFKQLGYTVKMGDEHYLVQAFARHRHDAAIVLHPTPVGYLTYDEDGRDEEFMRSSLGEADFEAGCTQKPVYLRATPPDALPAVGSSESG